MVSSDVLDDIFKEDGIIKYYKPDYEPRPSQIMAAHMISQAIESAQHAVIEGPCGFGKTFAYLIPICAQILEAKAAGAARIEAGEKTPRAIITTNGIALQEQLMHKDAPIIEQIFKNLYSEKLVFALLKGRNNFLCFRKLAEFEHSWALSEKEHAIVAWSKSTYTGDISELKIKIDADFAGKFCCIEDGECLGRNCAAYSECYYQRHKIAASHADVIITNYHLLFSDVKVKKATAGNVSLLPVYDMIVFDEAHDMAGIFRDFTEKRIGVSAIRYVRKKLHELYTKHELVGDLLRENFEFDARFDSADKNSGTTKKDPLGDRCTKAIDNTIEAFTEHLTKASALFNSDYQRTQVISEDIKTPDVTRLLAALKELQNIICTANDNAKEIKSYLLKDDEQNEALNVIISGLTMLHAKLSDGVEIIKSIPDAQMADNDVLFYEQNAFGTGALSDKINICSKMVKVAQPLFDTFFGQPDLSCILTSATLSINEKMDYICEQTGLGIYKQVYPQKEVFELMGQSPFDLTAQQRWYIPDGASKIHPYRHAAEFKALLEKTLQDLVITCRGGMLCLVTANMNIKPCADAITRILREHRLENEITVYQQKGGLSNAELLRLFKEDTNSVLVATRTFFTGIDIPGEALRCLVIDKLPFPPPEDPVMVKLSKEEGSFLKYSVPMMIIPLRQAVGRGVRTVDDKCVISIVDGRFRNSMYSRIVADSFGYKKKPDTLAGIKEFLDK